MKASELRKWIIIPTLKTIGLYDNTKKTESSIKLLLGTCAQESNMGEYLRQKGFSDYTAGAFGIYQCEAATHRLVLNWLKKNNLSIYNNVVGLYPSKDFTLKKTLSIDEQLMYNLYYATAIARCLYLSISEPLPEPEDIKGLASYYKRFYNTAKGKATEQQFIDNFYKYECDK